MMGTPFKRLVPLAALVVAIYPPLAFPHAPAAQADHEVIVVGGGIAGLTAAAALVEEDYDVLLLEKNDRAGGRVLSGEYQGFDYAKGTEYLGTPEDTLAEIIDALDLSLVEIPGPTDAVFYGDQFYFGEGVALLIIENSSLAEFNRFMTTIQEYMHVYDDVPAFDMTSTLAALDAMSAREWFEQQGFSAILQERYNVAARGLFGASLDEISALSFLPEIAFDFEGSEPIDDLADLENIPDPDEETDTYSFVRGITEVTDGLAAFLGRRVQLNSTVIRVTQQDDLYFVTYQDTSGTEHTLSAAAVILAVPAPIALRLAPDVLSAEQQALMGQIEYASYATVAMFSAEPIFTEAFDLAVPDGYFFTDLYDATWIQRHYDPFLRYQKAYVLSAYVAPQSYHDRSLLEMSDDEIIENVYRDLEKIFPGASTRITGYDLHRFPYAYPVMTVGAYGRLTRLHEITTGTLQLAGDYMIYPTFEAAVESGAIAAEKTAALLE